MRHPEHDVFPARLLLHGVSTSVGTSPTQYLVCTVGSTAVFSQGAGTAVRATLKNEEL